MNSSSSESIRATAIEAGEAALRDFRTGSDHELSTLFVDAVLPAVVAQVQADTWDEGKLAEKVAAHARRGWELSDTSDPKPIARNPYREKVENSHE